MALPEHPAKGRRLILALYPSKEAAQYSIDKLIKDCYVMDEISLLGRVGEGSGDDLLGVSYHGAGERLKVWGGHGAFWGGIWGLLASASGLFFIPGIGPGAAAGYVVGAILVVIAGTTVGAVIGGGAMLGAAAVSQLSIALHRQGVPKDKLQHLHDAIREGRYLVMLRCGANEVDHWRSRLDSGDVDEINDFRYVS